MSTLAHPNQDGLLNPSQPRPTIYEWLSEVTKPLSDTNDVCEWSDLPICEWADFGYDEFSFLKRACFPIDYHGQVLRIKIPDNPYTPLATYSLVIDVNITFGMNVVDVLNCIRHCLISGMRHCIQQGLIPEMYDPDFGTVWLTSFVNQNNSCCVLVFE